MKRLFIIIAILAIISFAIFLAHDTANEQARLRAVRYTYTGTVTAVAHGGYISQVWLNSQPTILKIRGGDVELAVGKTYEITIDGNGQLINAKIIEEQRQ